MTTRYAKTVESVLMPDGLLIEVGKEYMYFDEFVKVESIRSLGDGDGEAIVRNRWGMPTSCELGEIYAKPVYKKKAK